MYIHVTCYHQTRCLILKSTTGSFVSAARKLCLHLKLYRPTRLNSVTDVQIEWSCTSIPFTCSCIHGATSRLHCYPSKSIYVLLQPILTILTLFNSKINFFLSLSPFFVALRLNAGHGLLVLEVSRSHTTTHHSR